jgi:hypothetical protein
MTKRDEFLKGLPELDLKEVERDSLFLRDGRTGLFMNQFQPLPVKKPKVKTVLPCPQGRVLQKRSMLWVTYPIVRCHPVFEDVYELADTKVKARLSKVTKLDDVQIRVPMVCTTFSGPWTAAHIQTLDSCGHCGQVESHRLVVLDFPTIDIQWFGVRDDMPVYPNLQVLWGTESNATELPPRDCGIHPDGGGFPA